MDMRKPRVGVLRRVERNRCSMIVTVVLTGLILCHPIPLNAAPTAELWSKWQGHDPESKARIDHAPWNAFLKANVHADHPSGINRVGYASVTPRDRKGLADYIDALQSAQVTALNRSEQKAFWVNLYNALTVKIIVDHYPVTSIRDIDISPGWFSDGPWGAKLLTIEGESVSLDDMEHRILRPIWKDNRIHYAVNCASLGCPNLQKEAFTADNMERLLEKGAREYVNHSRGVKVEKNALTLSSIYKWFKADFGNAEKGVLEHLRTYADKALLEKLKGFDGKIVYDYDWNLNN